MTGWLPGGDLGDALGDLAGRPRILVASDFDGCLAPFDVDPMAVRPAAGSMAALREAARLPGVHVALVSGRDVDTLAHLAGVTQSDRLHLVGSHGGQVRTPADGDDPDQTATDAPLLDTEGSELLARLTTALREIQTRHPRARLEIKPASVSLHTRGLPDDVAAPALDDARALAAWPGVHVVPGKSVVELTVIDATKGAALLRLVDSLRASASCYFGDDVTDETAFEALDPDRGDVTVKVGDGPTAAAYRVSSVADVVVALQHLVTLRRHHAADDPWR